MPEIKSPPRLIDLLEDLYQQLIKEERENYQASTRVAATRALADKNERRFSLRDQKCLTRLQDGKMTVRKLRSHRRVRSLLMRHWEEVSIGPALAVWEMTVDSLRKAFRDTAGLKNGMLDFEDHLRAYCGALFDVTDAESLIFATKISSLNDEGEAVRLVEKVWDELPAEAKAIGLPKQVKPCQVADDTATATGERPWNEDDPAFIPATKALAFTSGKMNHSFLSRTLQPDGPIRYMRKAQRCLVHARDFIGFVSRAVPGDTTEEALEACLDGVERRKAEAQRLKTEGREPGEGGK